MANMLFFSTDETKLLFPFLVEIICCSLAGPLILTEHQGNTDIGHFLSQTHHKGNHMLLHEEFHPK
jgi:hypothetical protein